MSSDSSSHSSYSDDDDFSTSSSPQLPPQKVILLIRSDLAMSAGKVAAQSGHAIHALCRECPESIALTEWEEFDSTIIALSVKDLDELQEVLDRAVEAGIPTFTVQDAGRTEVEEGTTTCAAIGPAGDEQLKGVTGMLKLYK